MSFKQFIVIPVFIAFQAFIMMLIAPFILLTGADAVLPGLVTWIAFQAWAMYFLGGCNLKMAGKTIGGYVGGIIASVAIFELAGVLSGLNTATPWGLYVAAFIVVIFVISMERVPGLDFVPSYFIGAGVYFALFTYLKKPDEVAKYTWYVNLAIPEMVACVIGLAFGWCTVTARTWYEAKIAKPAA